MSIWDMVADMLIVWFAVCVFLFELLGFWTMWMVADILCCVCFCLLDFSRCLGNVALTEVVFDFSSGAWLLTCLVLLLFEF